MSKVIWIAKRLPLLALVALLWLSTIGIAWAATERVHVEGNRFIRKHEYIDKGDRVRWRNGTNRFHNIRSTNLQRNWSYSVSLPADSTRRRRFGGPRGTYIYRCSIHSQISGGVCQGMCGFIHVQ